MALAHAIRRLQELILSGSILLIAALTIVNVFARSVLGTSLAFTEELSQFAIILVTFIGLGYAVSEGRHIRMTALYDQLAPGRRRIMMVVITAGTSALMFLLTYFAISYTRTLYELGTVSPALQVPLHAIYFAAPVGLGLAGLQYAMAALRNLRADEVYLSYSQKEHGGRDEAPGDGPVSGDAGS